MMKYRSPPSSTSQVAESVDTVIKVSGLLFGRMFWPLIAILTFGVVQSVRYGITRSDYLLLIIGSVVGVAGGALYYADIRMAAEGTSRWAFTFWVGPIGMLTYLFIVYLFFY